MHYQVAPYCEAKLVTCIAGSIYDVVIDLRANSNTYCQWLAIELSAHGVGGMLYIPEGFAHGFQTLEDHTEVFYQISAVLRSRGARGRGVRWNDPVFLLSHGPTSGASYQTGTATFRIFIHGTCTSW